MSTFTATCFCALIAIAFAVPMPYGTPNAQENNNSNAYGGIEQGEAVEIPQPGNPWVNQAQMVPEGSGVEANEFVHATNSEEQQQLTNGPYGQQPITAGYPVPTSGYAAASGYGEQQQQVGYGQNGQNGASAPYGRA